ncbi:YfbM family protein [Paenibacillus sp. 1P07SE]|uniref:YfbM family protein n=1 Tax=Paenibacillus sp. 1P07SE TaxID=3132209 RepID=UPI0039A4BC8E
MGMIGYFSAVSREEAGQLAHGGLELEDLNPYERPSLDIDKSWQAIHFVLCGDIADGEPPLGYVVPMLDAQAIEFGEFGAFYLLPGQVAEAAQALKGFTREDFRARYDIDQLASNQVYPVFTDEDSEEFFDYLATNLEAVSELYKQAAELGQGIVFFVS